ncbi:hypothetical protein NWP21_05430 [Anabaenopsis sp. FSS-46]|uniref:hypothetical protein n=1 Tax=Anabaenopsis sp. FSS-46 TaxID=2971766 RepID=UPI002474DF85|nr:hypothetical protein [Anabaenopsis sp. FSS-46]MDH6098289.1 hypothetical protein [Anabaenopsis sp. FSS-46]
MQTMAERLESLKAGIISAISLSLAFLITSLVNTMVLVQYFPTLASLYTNINFHWWLTGGIAGLSGFLFGVTYRYIIRTDNNTQLKSGAVLAFGLVRGLTQLNSTNIIPDLVQAGESIFWFAMGAIALDTAIQIRWVKPFPSTNDREQLN